MHMLQIMLMLQKGMVDTPKGTVSMYAIGTDGVVVKPLEPATVPTETVPLGITTTAIDSSCFPKNTPIVTDQGIIFIQNIDSAIHNINGKKLLLLPKL